MIRGFYFASLPITKNDGKVKPLPEILDLLLYIPGSKFYKVHFHLLMLFASGEKLLFR